MDLSRHLAELRKKAGLTQAQLADKINYSDKVISKWERGESTPDISALMALADLYGVSLDDLIKGTAIPRTEYRENTSYRQEFSPAPAVAPPQKFAKKHKKLLIFLASFLSVILFFTLAFSIIIPVQENRIKKELAGVYYLSHIWDKDKNIEYGFSMSSGITDGDDKDIGSAIASLKSEFKWFDTKLIINQNNQIVFGDADPMEYKMKLESNILKWFTFDFYSGGMIDITGNKITSSWFTVADPFDHGKEVAFYVRASDDIYDKGYELRFNSIKEKSLGYESPVNPAFTNYKLNRLYVKMAGFDEFVLDPDNLSPGDSAMYEAVINMYGKTLKLYDSKVEFSGSALALYNPASYTRSGNNITFTDEDLSFLLSAAVTENKFNLKIVSTPEMEYVFEYITL